jgi:ATP-dependent DNA ligase
VAIDKTTKKLLPFQELSRRKRKDVKVEDIQVRVCLFGFDLLYLNGEVRPWHLLILGRAPRVDLTFVDP